MGRPAKHFFLAAAVSLASPSFAAADLSFLQGLLANTPEGGWVKASTNLFSDSWASEAQGGVPQSAFNSYSNPSTVATAWSSMAWDTARAQLMLFGGGHANYAGNEMYIWQGNTGTWTRGSLPSRVQFAGDAVYYVVDDRAPQSAHTYDNSNYLPINDRYINFGGAAFNTGNTWLTRNDLGAPAVAGPWVWNPALADGSQVGGTTGSGYLPSSVGGQMWDNRAGKNTGTFGGSSVDGTSAYRTESGKDVVYLTRDNNASGLPKLYRYEAGNYAAGELDRWDVVATARNASSSQSSAAIDSRNNLYVRISNRADAFDMGLGVWDLDNINAQDPVSVGDTFVELVDSSGVRFETNRFMGIAYDDVSEYFVLWDGYDKGSVYYTKPVVAQNGQVASTWQVIKAPSTTAAQPNGNFLAGVLGKWIYVDELNAFIAMDEFSNQTQDSSVWLYKPFVTAVPEPGTAVSMALGLFAVGWRLRARLNRGG